MIGIERLPRSGLKAYRHGDLIGRRVMSTTNELESVSSTISPEAMELLGGFNDGIDRLVYQFAEDLARKREGASHPDNRPVQIEAADVRAAASAVIDGIKAMVVERRAPAELEDAISNMGKYLESKGVTAR